MLFQISINDELAVVHVYEMSLMLATTLKITKEVQVEFIEMCKE